MGPENALPTLRQAVEAYRTDVLEIDVRATSDGVLVLHHDPGVERVTDGHGRVNEMSWAEIQKLDAGFQFSPDGGRTHPFRGQGYRIPSLAEVFEAFPTVLLHIDVKQARPPIVSRVVDLIRRRGMGDRVFLGSTNDRVGRSIRRAAPEIATFPGRYGLWRLYLCYRLGFFRLYPIRDEIVSIVPNLENGRPVVTPEFVRAIHQRGRKLFVFVVDESEKQRQLLSWGVDGIMTDYPDRLRKTMDEFRVS
ncbi:MAG: glycerophosphodiester phosphodiesterase [Planctomycetes bacterium]|nr:glycerophosphodiester phosphodiesterase [Planctomycetota bacterium]